MLGGVQAGHLGREVREAGVAGICSGSPTRGLLPGSRADGGLEPRCRVGAGAPYSGSGAAGRKRSGACPTRTGRMAGAHPELGMKAATWAAGQAAERN